MIADYTEEFLGNRVEVNTADSAEEFDPISKPRHYTFSKFEVWDVIEAWGLPFCLGNVVKYVARAGRKDPAKEIEDLEKASAYLSRHIALLKRRGPA